MDQSPIQLVVFDLGGVLVRISRTWREVFERVGISEHLGAFDDSAGLQADMIELNRLFEIGRLDEAEMIDRIHARIAHCSRSQAGDLLDAWLVEPYAGIEGLFEKVAAAGVRTACLSNTNERHWRTMMHADARYVPLRRLEYRIASHKIGVAKPHPGAYEAVEHQSGIGPQQIAFFDDDESNCNSARDRGWHVRQIDYQSDTVAQMTESLSELGVW